jgi:hypothetical protein
MYDKVTTVFYCLSPINSYHLLKHVSQMFKKMAEEATLGCQKERSGYDSSFWSIVSSWVCTWRGGMRTALSIGWGKLIHGVGVGVLCVWERGTHTIPSLSSDKDISRSCTTINLNGYLFKDLFNSTNKMWYGAALYTRRVLMSHLTIHAGLRLHKCYLHINRIVYITSNGRCNSNDWPWIFCTHSHSIHNIIFHYPVAIIGYFNI